MTLFRWNNFDKNVAQTKGAYCFSFCLSNGTIQSYTRAERLAPENYRVIGQISEVGVAKVDMLHRSLCETRYL